MPTIECTEKQMRLIQEAVEFTSRFDCGQLGFSYMPHAATKEYWKSTGDELTKWLEKRDQMEFYFSVIKKIWWDLEPDANWGVGHDDDADALFDMYQVIRHEIWKSKHKDGDPVFYSHDEYPATKFGKEELIKVKI